MPNTIKTDDYHNVENVTNDLYTASEEYSEILKYYELEYEIVDYYLQVGEITQVQGWIIHLSAVIWQVKDLLKMIVPLLAEKKIPFKIVMDKDTASNLLNGNLGISNVSKIVSIYPNNDNDALSIAKHLIELTSSFEGPSIPTDFQLGNIVYTRYGSFNPLILANIEGKEDKYIYDHTGQLIRDPYNIPFELPNGISWPYGSLIKYSIPKPKKILKNRYKPLAFLKIDIRGNVFKAIYLKKIFWVSPCVVKQGNKNMVSEDSKRTIRDRLTWQEELHKELEGIIPLPKILDSFVEDGDTYLVMEYVKGRSLFDRLKEINFNSKSWIQLTLKEQLELLDYLLEIISVIATLHQRGYVHRDIVPGNFLITEKKNIVLIDLELSFSINKGRPHPPFEYGTPGFMSPEQQATQIPTSKEDIYGLGALMVMVFTGLSPIKFDTSDSRSLKKSLYLFIKNEKIVNLISDCLSLDPELRPDIFALQSVIENYRSNITLSGSPKKYDPENIDAKTLREVITAAIAGLSSPPMVILDDLWYSKIIKTENIGAHTQKEYTRYGGMHAGIAGVLYLMARAKTAGFNIEAGETGYFKGWEFIEENYFKLLPDITPGLYYGAAGIALSLATGMKACLLDDTTLNRSRIKQSLELPCTNLDLSTGIAGQGISILQCEDYQDKEFSEKMLNQIIRILLDTQQKDGSWLISPGNQPETTGKKNVSFGQGMGGIVWFLLQYSSQYQNTQVKEAISKSIEWLLKTTNDLKHLFHPKIYKTKILTGREIGDERKGIILLLLKAYEVLHQESYKEMVEEALRSYPKYIVKTDFSQDIGLAGMGELYLEAHRVLHNKEWEQRAAWIANIFLHTFIKNVDGSVYWLMEENNNPTADLMIGNSGIIHFLLRYLNPTLLGYRLLA